MTRGLLRTSAGSALGDLLAVVEHRDVLGDAHHDLHVVLDQHDRHAALVAQLAHEGGQVGRLLRVHARRRLVEQQDLRVRGQRAGDLHPPLLAVGEVDREPVVVARAHADVLELVVRLLARPRLLLAHARRAEDRAEQPRLQARVLAHQHVLRRGHRPEQADVLERPRHAELHDHVRAVARDVALLEVDPAERRLVEAGEHVEERRLARAVGPDDRDDRALGRARTRRR